MQVDRETEARSWTLERLERSCHFQSEAEIFKLKKAGLDFWKVGVLLPKSFASTTVNSNGFPLACAQKPHVKLRGDGAKKCKQT